MSGGKEHGGGGGGGVLERKTKGAKERMVGLHALNTQTKEGMGRGMSGVKWGSKVLREE